MRGRRAREMMIAATPMAATLARDSRRVWAGGFRREGGPENYFGPVFRATH